MKIKINKILNNNVVISINENGEEVIFMGRGLAFQKKIGDTVDPIYVEKEFILKDSLVAHQFQELFADIAPEEVEVVKQMIDQAEKMLQQSLSSNIYLTLTDHIHYAIQRVTEGIELPNPLVHDIRKFYPKEYQVAEQAVSYLKKELGVQLPESEVGFIAFHIVNAEQGKGSMETTIAATEIVRDILAIIRRFFGKEFKQDSLSYQRIVTHLQYFAQRYLNGEITQEDDEFLYELIQSKYPKSFQSVLRINDYLIKTYSKSIGKTEMIYLTIHIERVTGESKY